MKRTAEGRPEDSGAGGAGGAAAASSVAPAKKTMRELVKGGDDEGCVKTISPTSGFIGEGTYTYIDDGNDEAALADDGAGAVRFVNGKLILNRNYHVPTSSVVESYTAPLSKRKAVSLYSRRGDRKQLSQKWTTEETEKFFHALRTFGTDFTLMEGMFKGRDRRQIKAKFKKEERDHPELVDMALRSTIPLNEKKLRDAGISFEGDKNDGDGNGEEDINTSAFAAALLSGHDESQQSENAAAAGNGEKENSDKQTNKGGNKEGNGEDEDDEALLRELFGDDDDEEGEEEGGEMDLGKDGGNDKN